MTDRRDRVRSKTSSTPRSWPTRRCSARVMSLADAQHEPVPSMLFGEKYGATVRVLEYRHVGGALRRHARGIARATSGAFKIVSRKRASCCGRAPRGSRDGLERRSKLDAGQCRVCLPKAAATLQGAGGGIARARSTAWVADRPATWKRNWPAAKAKLAAAQGANEALRSAAQDVAGVKVLVCRRSKAWTPRALRETTMDRSQEQARLRRDSFWR